MVISSQFVFSGVMGECMTLSVIFLTGAVHHPQRQIRQALREFFIYLEYERLVNSSEGLDGLTCCTVCSAGELPAEARQPGLSVRIHAGLQQRAGLSVGTAGQDPAEGLERPHGWPAQCPHGVWGELYSKLVNMFGIKVFLNLEAKFVMMRWHHQQLIAFWHVLNCKNSNRKPKSGSTGQSWAHKPSLPRVLTCSHNILSFF